MSSRPYLLSLVVAVVALAIAAIHDGSRALDAHEAVVAQTATEMVERGDYLVPHFNGSPRLQKPPLAYWLAIAAHEAARLVPSFASNASRTRARDTAGASRVSEFEARAPSLIAAALLLFVIYRIGATAFDPRVGLLATAFLATSWGFFEYARSARPEMLYALFCAIEMLGLVVAVERAKQGRSTVAGAMLAWGGFAAALLAKGPQFPLFIMLGTAAALATAKPRLPLREVFRPILALAAIAVVAPYFVFLASQSDGAVSLWAAQVVQDEPVALWLRPLRFYYPIALVAALVPWDVALAYAVMRSAAGREHHAIVRALLWCIALTLLILSFAGKLRPHYVLPIVPLCALLAAWAVVRLQDDAAGDDRARSRFRTLVAAELALVGVAIVAVATLASGDNCTGIAMWPRAIGPLLLACVLLGAAARSLMKSRTVGAGPADEAAARLAVETGAAPALHETPVARPWAWAVSSVLAVWLAVTFSGADVSSRWTLDAVFGRAIARAVPADQPVLFDSGDFETQVYYSGRVLRRVAFDDWLKERVLAGTLRERPPLFICEGRCGTNNITGDVLFAQAPCGKSPKMILFRPSLSPR